MKKKPWVKVAALALALTLLWMNMADVRNIVNANAESDDGGSVTTIDVVFDETAPTVDDTVTITVTASGKVSDVKVTLGVEGSAAEMISDFQDVGGDGMTWTNALFVSEKGWTAGTRVSIASVTATAEDGTLIEGDVGDDDKYSFTVKDGQQDPEQEDDENNSGLAITAIKLTEAEDVETSANYATITVTTSSKSGAVHLVLGCEEAGEEKSLKVDADPAEGDESRTSWILELPRATYDWTDGTKVYIQSVMAEDGNGNSVKGEVSDAEGDKTVATAENAKYSFTVKGNSGGGADDPDAEKKPLTIAKIEINPQNTVARNGSAVITVTTSGKADNVTVKLGAVNLNEDPQFEVIDDFESNADGTVWTKTLTIKDYKDWTYNTKVYIAVVTAEAEGETTANGEVSKEGDDKYNATAEDAAYSFIVANADLVAPVVDKIEINEQGETLKDGDKVTITVEAHDDDSGVDSVEVSLVGRENSLITGFTYDAVKGVWEKELTISESFNTGKIYVASVRAKDKIGNLGYGIVSATGNTYANKDDASCWFMVEREEVEVKRPTVDAVTLTENGTTVKPDDSINIEVQASAGDLDLMRENGCEVYFSCTETGVNNSNAHEWLDLNWNEEKGCYSGSMKITESMYPGKWEVRHVSVEDISHNTDDWYSSYSSTEALTFTIENEDYDTQAPEITSVEMDKRGELVYAGQEVKLSVEATDNGGVEFIYAELYAAVENVASDASYKTITLSQVGESGQYEGSFEIDALTYPAEWYIDYIYIRDTSGNYRYIRGCQDGVYTGDYWSYSGKAYSKDSYSLEEHCYVLVNNGNSLSRPDISVSLRDFSESGDSYGYQRTVEVPRRAPLSEIRALLGEGSGPDGLDFEGWIPARGTSDESEDPMVLWTYNSVSAKYDKNVILLELYDSFDVIHFMTGTKIYTGMLFGKEGETIQLPTDIKDFSEIHWMQKDEIKYVETQTYTVTGDPVQVISGMADKDSSAPATSDTPNTPDTPVRPPYAEPVVLPGQKIAEVVAEIAAAGNGATITVAMGEATVVSKDILEAAKGKDVDVVLQMDGYTWTINGMNILSENLKDINLRVIRNTEYIPGALISRLAGDNPVEQITLEYEGDFGFKADLTMNIGSQYAGKTGNLYWHDSDGRMIFMNAGAIDAAGNVTLGFSHASDYAIVITGPAATIVPNTAAASVSTSAATTPKTGDELPVVPYAAVCAVGFVGILIAGVVIKKRRGK